MRFVLCPSLKQHPNNTVYKVYITFDQGTKILAYNPSNTQVTSSQIAQVRVFFTNPRVTNSHTIEEHTWTSAHDRWQQNEDTFAYKHDRRPWERY